MKFVSLALMMLLFASCDKETPAVQGDTLLKPDPSKILDNVVVTEDVKTFTVNGFQMEVGKKYNIREIPALWEHAVNELKLSESDFPSDNARTYSIAHRFILTTFTDNCTGDPEDCPELGQQLQGRKGSSYTQIANANSYNPFGGMSYKYDPKPLNNVSDDYNYHYYRHVNYNGSGSISASFYVIDSNFDAWSVDTDVMSISDYGQWTFFEGWSELESITSYPTFDENAVRWQYSSCCY